MTRARPVADLPPVLTLAGPVATLRLSRPAAHNRIDPDDLPVIRAHLETVRANAAVRMETLDFD